MQSHANPIRFLDYVAVRDDVAFGVNNDAGTQRALANRATPRATLSAWTTEKSVEKIVERIGVIVIRNAASSARSLDRGLGINVDDTGLELFGYL